MSATDAPRHALNLALARVAVSVLLLTSSEVLEAPRWAELGRAVRMPATGLGWAMPLLDAGLPWVGPVRAICIGAALLAALGWRPRLTLRLAALTGTLLFALPHFSGAPRHSMHVVWLALLLAFSPMHLRLRIGSVELEPRAAFDLRLALAASWLLLGAVYFFPGLWKLIESGPAWVFSDNLRNQMYWKWYQASALPAWRLDQHPVALQLGALGVVLFELGFPFMLWRRNTRLLAAAAGLLFHWAAAAFMYLPFTALLACYAVLIDWEWLLAWLRDEQLPAERWLPAAGAFAARRRQRAAGSPAGAPSRGLAAVSALLVAGAFAAGTLGVMRAYPFACYPTFQWRAGVLMPDLWIELVGAGAPRWLTDGPAQGGVRAQSRWGVAWRAAGVYGDAVTLEPLVGYYRTLPEALQAERGRGERVRFYRVQVDVRPEARGAPPASLELLGEWSPEVPLTDAAASVPAAR